MCIAFSGLAIAMRISMYLALSDEYRAYTHGSAHIGMCEHACGCNNTHKLELFAGRKMRMVKFTFMLLIQPSGALRMTPHSSKDYDTN